MTLTEGVTCDRHGAGRAILLNSSDTSQPCQVRSFVIGSLIHLKYVANKQPGLAQFRPPARTRAISPPASQPWAGCDEWQLGGADALVDHGPRPSQRLAGPPLRAPCLFIADGLPIFAYGTARSGTPRLTVSARNWPKSMAPCLTTLLLGLVSF
jgi:hypothetical protein